MNAMSPEGLSAAEARLQRVQRWIMSTLLIILIWTLATGFVLLAVFTDRGRTNQIGMIVVAALMGIGAFVGARALHQRFAPHPILLVGAAPALVGAWWIWWR